MSLICPDCDHEICECGPAGSEMLDYAAKAFFTAQEIREQRDQALGRAAVAEQELAAAEAEIVRLRAAVLTAADGIEFWGAYSGDYFAEKWGLTEDIRTARASADPQ